MQFILGGTSVLDLITIYKIQNATPFSRGHYSGICGLIENWPNCWNGCKCIFLMSIQQATSTNEIDPHITNSLQLTQAN